MSRTGNSYQEKLSPSSQHRPSNKPERLHTDFWAPLYISDTKAELALSSPLESPSGYHSVKSDLTLYHTTTTHQNVVQNDKAIITKLQSHYPKMRILLTRKFDCTCNAHLTAEHSNFPYGSSPSTCQQFLKISDQTH